MATPSPSPSNASSGSGHKPRRKIVDGKIKDIAAISPASLRKPDPPVFTDAQPAFPLVAFFWPARAGVSQWLVLPVLFIFIGLFRWVTGFWGYSGFESPPMHGDFEAQRHWMELTINLPMSQWYFHDLEWWGLDYPPLTAYHSWVLGKIGSIFNPSWFALSSSRGLDDPGLKIFMRATVLVCEFLTYIPAILLLLRRFARLQRSSSWEYSIALAAILMQPATILIDHAHFQYNTVMLGFVVASVTSIFADKLLLSCIFFVAALSYKQMALYYAPAIFAYLLGVCIFPRISLTRFISIATVTILSFAIVLAPMLIGIYYDMQKGIKPSALEVTTSGGGWKRKAAPVVAISPIQPLLDALGIGAKHALYPYALQVGQIVHRVFPFARGLFEDKVANFWCALHTFHKLHRYTPALLQQISLGATLVSIAPACLVLFFSPKRGNVPLALASCAWGFFLFSFQVHEKSVLLPLLPMTLLLGSTKGPLPPTRSWIAWANILATWTLFPLLKRDQLQIPYFVLTLLWAWLMGVPTMLVIPFTAKQSSTRDKATALLHGSFYLAMVAWHVAERFVKPPSNKPDLWVVANVLIGAAGFAICYVWCLWRLLRPLLESRLSLNASKSKNKPKTN